MKCKSILTLFSIISFSLFANETKQEIAPDWQLLTQSGKDISLKEYQNTPLILHFWATWCPYCKRLQPGLVALEKKYQSEGVTIVSISFNEDEGAMPQDEIHQRGYKFITAVHGEKVAKLYGVSGTPTTFFINRKGEVIYRTSSSDISNPKIELAIKAIIK